MQIFISILIAAAFMITLGSLFYYAEKTDWYVEKSDVKWVLVALLLLAAFSVLSFVVHDILFVENIDHSAIL